MYTKCSVTFNVSHWKRTDKIIIKQSSSHLDLRVAECRDEGCKAYDVEQTVSEKGPPCQLEDFSAEQTAHPNHEQDVEDGGANYCACNMKNKVQ